MALLLVDSFPYDYNHIYPYKWDNWASWGSGVIDVLNASPRFTNGRYLFSNCGNNWFSYVSKNIPQNQTLMVQFGYKRLSGGSSQHARPLQLRDSNGDGIQVELRERGGYFSAWSQGNQLGNESTTLVNTTNWGQVELKAYIHNTQGTVLVKHQGVTVLNLSNVNTRQGSTNAYTNKVCFGSWFTNGVDYPIGVNISDIIVMDTAQVNGQNYCNDLLGPKMVMSCLPTANGNYAQWTPSAGSNWQNVDETPPNDDSDYNKTAGVGNIDSFVVPDIVAGATINGVSCSMYAKLEEPGSAKLKGLMRTGSTDGEGTEVVVPNAYNYLQSFIYVDPVSGVPMTAAEFNAAQFGYKRSA